MNQVWSLGWGYRGLKVLVCSLYRTPLSHARAAGLSGQAPYGSLGSSLPSQLGFLSRACGFFGLFPLLASQLQTQCQCWGKPGCPCPPPHQPLGLPSSHSGRIGLGVFLPPFQGRTSSLVPTHQAAAQGGGFNPRTPLQVSSFVLKIPSY